MRRRLLRNASLVLAAWLTLWGLNRLAEAQQTSVVSGGGGGQVGGRGGGAGGGGGVSGGTSLFGQQGSTGAGLSNAMGGDGAGYSGGQGGFTGNTNTATSTGRGGGGAAGGGATIPDKSNVLGSYYANPLSLGIRINGSTGKPTFNQPLFATTTTASTRTKGGTRTGTGTATTSSIVGFTTYGMDRAIPYRTELGKGIPLVTPVASALQAELNDIVQRSTRLTNNKNIEVSVANGTVFLRGQVATEDERGLVERLIRLTPGVPRMQVSNELTIAAGGKE